MKVVIGAWSNAIIIYPLHLMKSIIQSLFSMRNKNQKETPKRNKKFVDISKQISIGLMAN